MSKMFVIAIEDNAQADAFLTAMQQHKLIAYPTKEGSKFHRARVLYAYLTNDRGKCTQHQQNGS